MILISQEEKAKNLELLKITVGDLFNNSKCPKCYKKFNCIKCNSNFYKKSEDVSYVQRFSGTMYLSIFHTPCNSYISIKTNYSFNIEDLHIKYSYYKDPKSFITVHNTMRKNQNNEIYFNNFIYYGNKNHRIESTDPFCKKQVNRYINNLIFE